jgi:hypothetical protein
MFANGRTPRADRETVSDQAHNMTGSLHERIFLSPAERTCDITRQKQRGSSESLTREGTKFADTGS